MPYPYGVWWDLYRRSGLHLPLDTRKALHLALRPLPDDATLTTYRVRCIAQVPRDLGILHLARPLRDLEIDEWQSRWDHAAWHPQPARQPFAHDEHQRPLYAIPAVCARCGHEFLGREAIGAPSITTCSCFWCWGALRVLPRYPRPPATDQQTMLAL